MSRTSQREITQLLVASDGELTFPTEATFTNILQRLIDDNQLCTYEGLLV